MISHILLFVERYILTFLGCALTAGGTYLFVTFGPNSHEKLNAENIVKHVIGWPFLLYLVIHTPSFGKLCDYLMRIIFFFYSTNAK